jgi:hypothetical protein
VVLLRQDGIVGLETILLEEFVISRHGSAFDSGHWEGRSRVLLILCMYVPLALDV